MAGTTTQQYEVWDEDKTRFQNVLRLDAATYLTAPIFDIPSALPHEVPFVISPKGSFAYQNRILPKGQKLRVFRKQARGSVGHEGHVVWNGDVAFPTLIDMNVNNGTGERFSAADTEMERVHAGAVWMSLTPMEMLTQRSGVNFACKTVVIGGLGLGWLLRKVCEKPEVERVIVVEKSRELLDWYGLQMCRRYEKVVDVICDDIYQQIGKHGVTTRYLLDIWLRYGGAVKDSRLDPFRKKMREKDMGLGAGFMNLDNIASQIIELHSGLTLRTSLERAQQIGELLLQAKAQVPRGNWREWVHGLGIGKRTSEIYQQVAKAQGTALSNRVTIQEFVRCIRTAKRLARYDEQKEAREAAIAAAGHDDKRFVVHHADCRKFQWPRDIDLIATDPPWQDLDLYRWLGKMGWQHLRHGGLLMVQTGTKDVADVLPALGGAGLEFVWILAIVFDKTFSMNGLPLNPAWRPVLCFSRDKWDTTGLRKVTDTITSNTAHNLKTVCHWQQPARPWHSWIDALTRPNALVADPFTGSGTNGIATKAAGAGRQFLGTELDPEVAAIAQGRINSSPEGKPPK